MSKLVVYNTLTRQKELFEPIKAPQVGMYVCGPTVYGDPHLGHARGAVTFDIVYRYLTFLGFKVRYVRNITDVGHLENDSDNGDDKIAKKARLEQVEPMEIAQQYTNSYHREMDLLNVLRPNIEPRATGHIIEQIDSINKILQNGLAYESNGSVYFDVEEYSKKHHYGILSGRVLEDLVANTRDLDGQSDKKGPLDFALWKKANTEHIMKWNSPWGEGFPGWHIECSSMSTKYLGDFFDIHGGGMDLTFPHHECEIAQSQACNHHTPAKYWLHNNMITIDGRKMGKSLNNFINLNEFFTGSHPLLEQAYSPMNIRFYILQAQYRSTLDISNTALKAANVAYIKLLNAFKLLDKLSWKLGNEINVDLEKELNKCINECHDGMNDDFNTGMTISGLFGLANYINQFHLKQKDVGSISENLFHELVNTYRVFFQDILGLKEQNAINVENTIEALLTFYQEAKSNKQYDKVDHIRLMLKKEGIVVKDLKDRIEWAYEA